MKKLLIFSLVVLLLVVAGWFYLKQRKSKDLEPLIKTRLSELVQQASGGLYKLELGTVEADILESKLTMVKLHLVPDTSFFRNLELQKKAPNDLWDVYIDKLSIGDINIPALLGGNTVISLNKIFIDAPVVKVWHKKQSYNTADADSSKTLYQQISKDVKRIKIDTILLREVSFTHYNKRKNNKETSLDKVNFIFTGLLIDSSTQFDQTRFLYTEDCRISLKDYTIFTPDKLYKLTAGDMEIRTRDQLMKAGNISLQPTVSRKAFYEKVKHQQDIFKIDIERLDFEKIDWWNLLAEEAFLSEKMNLENGKIVIYNDKSQTPDSRSKRGKFPHQLLAKLPFNIRVDTMGIKNIDVSYEELNPKSGETGTLYFNNIKGNITNITNDSARISSNSKCRIDVNAIFLRETPLKADFVFDLNSIKTGAFSVKARMGAIDEKDLNKILLPLAMVKANSLKMKSLDVTMTGNNYRGSGRVKMIYDDLNIAALKNDGDTVKKRGLLSFIANNFVIKKENPSGGNAPRVEQAEHEHDPTKSFFNLVWKTIFAGAGKTVGYNTKK